jgi:N-sulfoglucosamine sulfohydrolase
MYFLFLLNFLFSGSAPVPPAPADTPNFVFVIADDLNWNDIGCYGNPKIQTPNIDRLARQGVRFTNMYLTASSCSPSRTSILSGRYPHNAGSPELHTALPRHLPILPEILRQQGYYTALAGKWHEGPSTRRAYDTLLVDRAANGEGGEEQWISLMQARPKNKPFFFWLAAIDAHRPWSAHQYGHRHNPDTDVVIPPSLLDTPETRKDLAAYYDEIARLDYYIGQLEVELTRQGIIDNTVFVFMSDNGSAFPGSKTRVNDSGMKSPFIIKWPKGIAKRGVTSDGLVSSIDIAPMLLHLAGIPAPATMQGRSFDQLLQKPSTPFRKYVFSEHNWHDYAAYERSVRTKDYLYLINKRPELDNAGSIDVNQSPSAEALKTARREGKLSAFQTIYSSLHVLRRSFSIPKKTQFRHIIK